MSSFRGTGFGVKVRRDRNIKIRCAAYRQIQIAERHARMDIDNGQIDKGNAQKRNGPQTQSVEQKHERAHRRRGIGLLGILILAMGIVYGKEKTNEYKKETPHCAV